MKIYTLLNTGTCFFPKTEVFLFHLCSEITFIFMNMKILILCEYGDILIPFMHNVVKWPNIL